MITKRVHVFRAGSQTSAQGVQRNFTEKDLDQVCNTYDPSVHEAPLVIGHQGDSDSLPSYGWIRSFSRQGKDLYAEVDFTDAAKDLVKNGHYRKVSISFYSPDSAINPNPGKWSARHLALLGASPPAVKGLEPFSFAEEGCFDFAVSLDPHQIFDEELGPSLLVEKSPLEMLKEKLETVRSEMGQAIEDMKAQGGKEEQQETQVDDETSAKSPAEISSATNKDSQFAESDISQMTANLEDQFPEDQFMDQHSTISRKRASGAHGQVMQVVENVYDEQHGEIPEAFRKNIDKVKAKAKAKKGQGEEPEEGGNPFAKEHAEVSHKTVSGGRPHFGKHPEGETMESDRMSSTRSESDSYGNRMKVGKQGAGGVGEDRMHTARSSEQDEDRLNEPECGEQDEDRMKTAKDASDNATGESRWAGQSEAEERIMNNDQYDVDEASYGVNKPGKSGKGEPAGRDGGPTRMPTETEETPDDTVFAVDTTNVMDDNNMRVLRKKSSDGRSAPRVAQTFGEPDIGS